MLSLSKEERTIFIYAFRYSLGRQTGALNDCLTYFKKHKSSYEKWELDTLFAEVNQQIEWNRLNKSEFVSNSGLFEFRNVICGILQEMEDGDGRFCR